MQDVTSFPATVNKQTFSRTGNNEKKECVYQINRVNSVSPITE